MTNQQNVGVPSPLSPFLQFANTEIQTKELISYLVKEELLHGLRVPGIWQRSRRLLARSRLGFVPLFPQLLLEIGRASPFVVEVDAVSNEGSTCRRRDKP